MIDCECCSCNEIVPSLIGVVPTGNTGGANVNPFKKMDIPKDLKVVLDK